MNENVWSLILLGGGLLAFLLVVSFLSKNYSLNNFKNKTVGDGQHGTARWIWSILLLSSNILLMWCSIRTTVSLTVGAW